MIYYIMTMVGLVFLDQLTKFQIVKTMLEGESIGIIQNFFHITYVQNRGIAFGIFQGKVNFITIATVGAIIGLIIYFYKQFKKVGKLENIGFAFIIAGAIGNIIDRIFRGFVVDMIDFRGIWTYVFNLADVYINIGVGLILLDAIINSIREKKKVK